MSTAARLSRTLKSHQGALPEVFAIRLHRAISWLKSAEELEKNPDMQFIGLWIACNSCYSADDQSKEIQNERDRFGDFAGRLAKLDSENRLYNMLWNKFTGPVRLLIENQYVYGPFWEFQRGTIKDWIKSHEQSIATANRFLSERNVKGLLQIVLDRLYTLRNQLVHGGATYKSKLNRAQVRDGSNMLGSLLPVVLDIMMANPEEDWGSISYPPLGG